MKCVLPEQLGEQLRLCMKGGGAKLMRGDASRVRTGYRKVAGTKTAPKDLDLFAKDMKEEKKERCPHCFREFTNLRHHVNQQHIQLKNFKCGDCGYTCYLKTDLERHIMNVHDKFRSPCPSCGKKYSDLRQHIRVVHEGAKAECPHCRGRYTNLSQHINKVHLKTKNVICEQCGSTFYHASNLKRHTEAVHLVK